MRSVQFLFLPVVVALLVEPARAATYVVPDDARLVEEAEAIVIGTVVQSVSQTRPDRVVTINVVSVEETLKGPVGIGSVIESVELGGATGSYAYVVPGTPTFAPGERVLLFLTRNYAGEWTILHLGLGRFTFLSAWDGKRLLLRKADEITGWDIEGAQYQERSRLEEGFLVFIRENVAGRNPATDYFVETAPDMIDAQRVGPPNPAPNALASAYLMSLACDSMPTRKARWNGFPSNVSFKKASTQSQAGAANGGVDAITAGLASWKDHSASDIKYVYGGTSNTENSLCDDPFPCIDSTNNIVFNDPQGYIPGMWTGSGTLAQGGFWVNCTTHDFSGETFYTIVSGDVVFQNNLSTWTNLTNGGLDRVMTHELGHTLGFRHSDEGSPSSSSAVMTASLTNPTAGATLATWDKDAAATVYGAGAVCGGPSITTQPASKTIGGGQTASLSVTATASSGSLSYQWYTGNSGDTSSPISGATSSSRSVTPTGMAPGSTTEFKYWVEVQDDCAEAGANPKNSNTATVTVHCNPAITGQPSNKNITSGSSASLTVTSAQATSFQWYQVNSACSPCIDTTTLVGSTSSSPGFNTGSLTTGEYYYWVMATTNCGSTNSNSAKVTVSEGCDPANITTDLPAATTIASGSSVQFTVTATGTAPLTYQWYKGSKPSTATPVGTNSNTYNTGALTTDTNFWVRVTNSCGSDDSRTATIDVVSCTLPAVTSITPDATITSGTAATLTVAGTNFTTVTWFRGALGDETQPIGSGATITSPVLTETTTFWARLTNSCGSTSSTLVTISVATACTAPVITVEPLSQKVVKNSSVNLSVIASGSAPMSYQWYEAASGVFENTRGGDSSSYNTGPLAKSTKFWVLVTNACGSDQSATATITIPVKRRAVRR